MYNVVMVQVSAGNNNTDNENQEVRKLHFSNTQAFMHKLYLAEFAYNMERIRKINIW